MEYFYTEKPYVWILIAAFPIYFLALSFIFLWSVNTRIEVINQASSMLPSLKNGLTMTRKRFWKSFALLLCFASTMVLLTGLYLLANDIIGMVSSITIILFILLQQIIAFLRILWRFMIYSCIHKIGSED